MTDQQKIIHEIARYWFKHRYLRFGQVLAALNILEYDMLRIGQQEITVVQRDIFHDTDKQILKRMKNE